MGVHRSTHTDLRVKASSKFTPLRDEGMLFEIALSFFQLSPVVAGREATRKVNLKALAGLR